MKYCPRCGYPNVDTRVDCYKCQYSLAGASQLSPSIKRTATVIAILIAVVVVAGLGLIIACLPDLPNESSDAEDASLSESSDAEDANLRKIEAFQAAQDFVRDRLKAPATAEFAGIRDDGSGVNDLGNEEYLVGSYVDSENSFGAKLRMRFECRLRRDPAQDTFYLVDLKTDEDEQ